MEKKIRTVKRYQETTTRALKNIFGESSVWKEWDVAKGSRDSFTRELYCPRLDIAAGPFNTDGNVERNNRKILRAVSANKRLIRRLFECSENKTGNLAYFLANKNRNPRCLLSIEIENSGSSKHMLGNVANVSIIGLIGIVVPFNEKKLSLCKRIKNYVAFATEAEKIRASFKNVLIISKNQFLSVLNEFQPGH